jgi:large subunit ribosomal protein L30
MTEKKMAAKKAAGKQTAREAPAKAKTGGKKEAAKSDKKVRVTLVRGLIGTRESHRATVRGLGLRRINHSVVVKDTPENRGMIEAAKHMVKVDRQ